jgi:hypothetical protein
VAQVGIDPAQRLGDAAKCRVRVGEYLQESWGSGDRIGGCGKSLFRP